MRESPTPESSPASTSSATFGYFAIIAGAALWSTGGVGIKWLPFPPLFLSAARSLLAAFLFFIIARGRILPGAGTRKWFFMGAISYAFVVTSFVVSNRMTTAANAIILQYTSPLWVLILAGPLLGEKPQSRDFLAMAIGLVGIVLCVRKGLQASGDGIISRQTLGDLIALSSGFMFGVCTLLMRRANKADPARLRDSHDAIRFICAGNLVAVAVAMGGIAMSPVERAGFSMEAISVASVLAILWLGFAQLGCGYLFVQHGLRTVPALRASMLTLIEPILNPVWVAIAVGEVPSMDTIIGGIFVLVAMMVSISGKAA